MLHNGLLNIMNRSTCFGHYYAHHQELATIQMAPACGTSPWLRQVAGLVHGCRLERWGGGMLHDSCAHIQKNVAKYCPEWKLQQLSTTHRLYLNQYWFNGDYSEKVRISERGVYHSKKCPARLIAM
jgi:hypothetical protein